MCVIIQRKPQIIIPEEKIWSACHVNPNGYGLSVIDRGKIETVKVHKTGGNDDKEVNGLLEQAKDHLVYLHLRYTTAGKSNEENCHPFKVFDGDNFEVQFMHNGTLMKHKKQDSDFSDTYHFAQDVLKPLLLRFYEIDGAGVLLNPLLHTVLEGLQGGSVFMLYDNEGNHLAVENSSCQSYEGWWASNTYSFNRHHRTPQQTNDVWKKEDYDYYNPNYGRRTYGGHSYAPPQNISCTTPAAKQETKENVQAAVNTKTQDECKKVGYAIMQAKKQGVVEKTLTHSSERLTFCDMAELGDIKDVMMMTEGDIYDLVDELPLAATALIMDLIQALWHKDQREKAEKAKNNNVVTIGKTAGAA